MARNDQPLHRLQHRARALSASMNTLLRPRGCWQTAARACSSAASCAWPSGLIGLHIEFEIAQHRIHLAPTLRRRAASASVCAQTAASAP
jgi:hypothetical protein